MRLSVRPLPPSPVRRRLRWRPALGLLAAVLALHALLLDGLAPGRRSGAAPRARQPAALQVLRLAPAAPPATVPRPVQAEAPGQPAGPAAQPDRVRPAAPAPAVAPALRAATEPVPTGAAVVRRGSADAAAGPADTPAGGAAAPATPPAALAVPATVAARDASDAPAPPDSGAPPPVYPTRLPAPVLLRYALRAGSQTGEASLRWDHDGSRYALQLDARGSQAGAAQLLIEQISQGGFDAAGLAPERFTDRRRGRGQRAVNFRRDIGRISFSGPTLDYPAWPGAQDRLSWLAQVAAISAAAAAAPLPLPVLTLFVVDARGGGAWWRFVAQGQVALDTPLGRGMASHWLREPEGVERDAGQRVELWLDPARGHWPLQLRLTTLRSGERFELQLSAEPTEPEPPAAPDRSATGSPAR